MILSALIGSVPIPLVAGQQFPSLEWKASYRAGGRSDVPRYTRQLAPPERILPLGVLMKAAAGEDTGHLDTAISLINAQLAVRNTLVLTNDEGSSATFATFPSNPLPPNLDARYSGAKQYAGTVEIVVEPYAYGAEDTISSADLATPGSVDLSAMEGEYPAPLTVTVDPGASTAAEMHGVWTALCPDGDWTGYLVEATAVTGWDDEIGDGTLGVNVVRFAFGDAADTGTVDVTDFPASAYLVLARIMVATTGSLSLDTPYTEPVVTPAITHYNWISLGEIVLPTQKSRGAATVTLSITGDASTANGYCQRLCFLPLRWGFLSYHDAATPADEIAALRAEWEDIYSDDVVDYEHVLGGGLKALGGQLIVLTEEAAGTAAHHHADVAVAYSPRRNWLG